MIIAVTDVKTKFKNMRTTYGREEKKKEESKKSGCSSSSLYLSKWSHYQRMTFLKDSMKAGPSRDSIPPEVCIIINGICPQ